MKLLTPEQINQLNELELQNIHGRLHAYFQQLVSGEKKFNREDLVNQKIFVLEEMRRRDMKHKVRDVLDEEALTLLNKSSFPAWLACFPEDKEALWKLQDKLGFARNEKADNDGLHCTVALFDDLDDISKIKEALEKADIDEFQFVSTGLNAYGKELNAIVLEGTIADKLQQSIERFRVKAEGQRSAGTAYDDTEYKHGQFLPHITLGYADEQPFNLLSPSELDKLVGIKIKMSKPILMVSIEKDHELIYSYIQEDENEIESELSINLDSFAVPALRWPSALEKKIDNEFAEALKKIKDLVVIENVCSVTGSSALPDKESNDIDLVWRMEFDDDGYARIDLRNILMKFDRAFPNEVSDKFDHISSPTGPSWSFIPLMDLVLRAKNTFLDVTHVDESYAYHKVMANVPGVGAEWKGETFWTNLKDELNELIDDKDKVTKLLSMISDYLTKQVIKDALGTGLGTSDERMGTGGTSYCYCHNCGTKITHDRGIPCNKIQCPQCGGSMTGVAYAEGQRSAGTAQDINNQATGYGQGIGNERQGTGGTSYCYCHECDIAVIHQRGIPCNELNCSICGKPMTGIEPKNLYSILFNKQKPSIGLGNIGLGNIGLGKEVQLMKPFKPIKSRAGLYEYEFFVGEEDVMWRTFAKPIIEG